MMQSPSPYEQYPSPPMPYRNHQSPIVQGGSKGGSKVGIAAALTAGSLFVAPVLTPFAAGWTVYEGYKSRRNKKAIQANNMKVLEQQQSNSSYEFEPQFADPYNPHGYHTQPPMDSYGAGYPNSNPQMNSYGYPGSYPPRPYRRRR